MNYIFNVEMAETTCKKAEPEATCAISPDTNIAQVGYLNISDSCTGYEYEYIFVFSCILTFLPLFHFLQAPWMQAGSVESALGEQHKTDWEYLRINIKYNQNQWTSLRDLYYTHTQVL